MWHCLHHRVLCLKSPSTLLDSVLHRYWWQFFKRTFTVCIKEPIRKLGFAYRPFEYSLLFSTHQHKNWVFDLEAQGMTTVLTISDISPELISLFSIAVHEITKHFYSSWPGIQTDREVLARTSHPVNVIASEHAHQVMQSGKKKRLKRKSLHWIIVFSFFVNFPQTL